MLQLSVNLHLASAVALGVPFLILAGLAELLRRQSAVAQSWLALAVFAAAGAVGAWLSPGGSNVLHSPIVVGAWVALAEFGRRGLPFRMQAAAAWLYLPIACVAGLAAWFGGAMAFETTCRYVLAIPGGVLAAVSLWRTSPAYGTQERIGLRVAAGALAAYAVAVVLAGLPVQTLCVLATATGLGVYGRARQAESGSRQASGWRLFFAAEFGLAIAIGATALSEPLAGTDETAVVAQLDSAAPPAGNTAVVGRVANVAQPAAWGNLLSQRQRRGAAVIVGALLATICLLATGYAVNRRNAKPAKAVRRRLPS